MTIEQAAPRDPQTQSQLLVRLFLSIGVLPILLVVALVLFSLMSDNFFTFNNIANVLRQTSYLTIVALGQMIVMLTAGFDLSVGSTLAVTSVTSALGMAAMAAGYPDQPWLAIAVGAPIGFLCGLAVGVVNGLGVALLGVSPFIVTLGMASVGFCAALYLTSGTPVRGIPYEFADTFGSGGFWGLKAPVWAALILAIAVYVLLNWTRLGRHFYAVGGNLKAAALSGVHTRLTLFMAYAVCAGLTSIAGLLLTARMETGEANIGTSMPLQSIAACVIAGVSLRGGTGNVPYVVLGAVFFGVVENGMNVSGTSSYLQIGVTGAILVFAAVADEFRRRLIGRRSL
ncbi:ABC transporter permease [Dongia sedimenti]|uniref:ABC transporter permease n=1 Tax=Dongia sedimenti TaxID=3064282 RepID=A0ABU0YPA2_9PROT|nr:ABC transporter permease [Rhodospirillaceae bacterium R-7]